MWRRRRRRENNKNVEEEEEEEKQQKCGGGGGGGGGGKTIEMWYFLSSYHKSFGYLKILQGHQLNFFSSNTEAAQDFRNKVDIKEAKSFGWIKEHAL